MRQGLQEKEEELEYMEKKQTFNENSINRFRIKVSKNGPYLISGGILLADEAIITDAEGYSRE